MTNKKWGITSMNIGLLVSCSFVNTSNNLSGTWIATGYTCYTADDKLEEIIDIRHFGDSIVATKLIGDDCVTSGQITWRGIYDGSIDNIEVIAQTGTPLNPNDKFVTAYLKIISADTLILTSIDNSNQVLFIRE